VTRPKRKTSGAARPSRGSTLPFIRSSGHEDVPEERPPQIRAGNGISTSIFELLKIGPGPSSSHTMAPMRAGHHFLSLLRKLDGETLGGGKSIEVRLFGSLSATGKGHGTDRAVIAGLLGQKPETCSASFLDGLLTVPGETHSMAIRGRTFKLSSDTVVFDSTRHDYPYANTLIIRLLGKKDPLLEQEYYSVGGGFLQWKGWTPPERGLPPYPYSTMAELRAIAQEAKLPIGEIVLENERGITGATVAQILTGLDHVLDAMEDSVKRGLRTDGLLPGTLGIRRRAHNLLAKAGAVRRPEVAFMIRLSAWAIASAEENAAGHRIVTAPTAGSAGVLPALAFAMRHHFGFSHQHIRDGLLAAAVIGFLCKRNASIAGAEVGCQGEIGVASSMGAAMVAEAFGLPLESVEAAAEIAMEHHLGLTCDPVGGYVQVPCIERCAMGATHAYTSVLLAAAEVNRRKVVSFDRVIQAMAETGRDMSTKYKETSEGGLAVSLVNC
jgi:L-serine dehydratase